MYKLVFVATAPIQTSFLSVFENIRFLQVWGLGDERSFDLTSIIAINKWLREFKRKYEKLKKKCYSFLL